MSDRFHSGLLIFKSVWLLIFIMIFMACPENGNNSNECGDHQVFIDGECQCEDGYYWDDEYDGCRLDTTSHNFNWSIHRIGENGSYFKDVWVVNENDIWAVGRVETDSGLFNSAHWNGDNWILGKAIHPGSYIYEVHSIHYINENNIWFGVGGLPLHWNGLEYYLYTPVAGEHPGQPSIDAIWSSGNSDMYFVGRDGSIVQFDGLTFYEITSSTDINLKDIWGYEDLLEGTAIVWACGYSSDYSKGVVLKNSNGQWEKLVDGVDMPFDSDVGNLYSSLWIDNEGTVFLSAYASVMKIDSIELSNSEKLINTGAGIYKIRGNSYNDIITVGEFGNVWHYNGSTWIRFDELVNQDVFLYGVSITSSTACAVGSASSSVYESNAIVYIGKRID